MEKQFEDILGKHNAIIFKVAKSYCYNDYEDLYQEILVQLWRSYQSFRGNSKISTWIYRVALNTALTYKRKNNNSYVSIDKVSNLHDDNKESNSESNLQKINLLYKCINELKADYKALIILQLEGYDYEEIADIVGISTNNVGVKLNRIKYRLQALLNKYNYGKL